MNAIGFAIDDGAGSLTESRAAREIAENRLAAMQASVEAAALERTRALIESPQPVTVPWAEYPQFDEFNQWPTGYERPYYWSSMDDRTEGRYLPLYETDQDLKRMRASARKLQSLFPVSEGALSSLTNYIFGSAGFTFTVSPKHKGAEQLAAAIQKVVDRFLDVNDFLGEMDRDIHDRTRVDGEAFPTLYPDESAGEVLIDLVEPDNILQPAKPEQLNQMLRAGHKLNYWWLGVHTQHCQQRKRDTPERPLGYHAVFDRHGEQWDYLPASRVEHIKRNVGRNARRGWSDFAIVQRDLEIEAKIRRNTAEGAAILAAIVMIREHAEGVTKSSIESMVASNSTASYERQTQNSSRTTYVEQTRPGTVKDTPYGMKTTVGPMGTLNQPVYIQVAQYVLRIIGHRWNMPEYLVSGDASNANYSSTLVAESPFVKAREHDQEEYARHFRRLIGKALRLYHGMRVFGRGLSWQQIDAAVEIKVDYPSVASRDKLQQAQVNQILADAKVLSKRTWAADSDLDYDEEQQQIASEPQPAPPMPLGMPGQPQPFGQPQRPPVVLPQRDMQARESYLAIRAIESLLEGAPERKPLPSTESGSVSLVEAIGVAMKGQPSPTINVHPPDVQITVSPDLSTLPPPQVTVNVPAPEVTVNVPRPEPPPEYDIEPVRDPKTKLVTKFKRTRKRD